MNINLPPQQQTGWMCPKCGRCYSPLWMTCQPCNERADKLDQPKQYDTTGEPPPHLR